jgi:N-hydroxyarylamine O-acetyltransferase
MKEFEFNKDEYLKRINYAADVDVSITCLKTIHRAQFYTIPFENFDICLGKGINITPEAIFQKLVNKKRGGYCFELNGLLLMALKSFGFNARALLARVHTREKPSGRGHQITLITLQDKQWIADVGFGSDTPRTPLPLEINQPISQNGQTLRLIKTKEFGYMLQNQKDNDWKDLYSFDLEYVHLGDIEYGNHFTSTHHSSFFTSSPVAALPLDNGKITSLDHTLKKTVNGRERDIELAEDQSYIDALQTHFGIELDASYDALKLLNE